MRRNDLTKSSHIARPITRIQEVLFIASAFVVGGVLQILVLLHLSVVLETGLASFIAAIE